MTHRLMLRLVIAVPAATALISCGGSATPPGPAAAQQPVHTAQVTGGGQAQSPDGEPAAEPSRPPPAGATSRRAAPATTGGGARPGGPAPGSQGGARPGGPFDVEAFENRGQDLASFRPFAAEHCADGRCILVEQTSTDPAAQEGCEIADFAYDPPARPAGAPPSEQFIQRGTTVTVFVHCPPATGASGAGDSGAAGSSSGDSTAPESTAPESTAPESSAPESSAPSDPASGSSAGAGG